MVKDPFDKPAILLQSLIRLKEEGNALHRSRQYFDAAMLYGIIHRRLLVWDRTITARSQHKQFMSTEGIKLYHDIASFFLDIQLNGVASLTEELRGRIDKLPPQWHLPEVPPPINDLIDEAFEHGDFTHIVSGRNPLVDAPWRHTPCRRQAVKMSYRDAALCMVVRYEDSHLKRAWGMIRQAKEIDQDGDKEVKRMYEYIKEEVVRMGYWKCWKNGVLTAQDCACGQH